MNSWNSLLTVNGQILGPSPNPKRNLLRRFSKSITLRCDLDPSDNHTLTNTAQKSNLKEHRQDKPSSIYG